MDFVRRFGERRTADGDAFVESEFLPGHFLYRTDEAHTGIAVWGEEDHWTFSAFAAARVNMRPTLELYRYVGRWRSTCGLGAPYVIEDGGAAVMCEHTVGGRQLYREATAWRILVGAIDLVGETARTIADDLVRADGVPFTAQGEAGLALLTGWWEIRDPRILMAHGAFVTSAELDLPAEPTLPEPSADRPANSGLAAQQRENLVEAAVDAVEPVRLLVLGRLDPLKPRVRRVSQIHDGLLHRGQELVDVVYIVTELAHHPTALGL